MNGAEAILKTAVASGVEVCFANPGTTEMPLVAALDTVPGIRSVLALFEGVCTGAADGYGRMSGKPAATLLHLGPGFANGIANLHNARRARTPIVNWIGDHATWHLAADAPLTSDIVSLANPVSGWVRSVRRAEDAGLDSAAAIEAARATPGQVATLIVPADCQWNEAPGPGPAARAATPSAVASDRVDAAARALRSGDAALMLGGASLGRAAQRSAARIRAATGARLLHDVFVARLERGGDLPAIERLPYFPEQAIASLAKLRSLVLVDARDPVAFFGYPNQPSRLAPDACERIELAAPGEDGIAALEALADALAAPRDVARSDAPQRPSTATGALDVAALGQTLAALQPEHAIVVDEGATSSAGWFAHAAASPSHTVLGLTGGAIGQGLPTAVGAAIACPDRKVIALQADGSGMYTAQALWTMARESLDIVVVICANRAYRILQIEVARAGIAEPGPAARALTDLSHPTIDWCALARGMGVPAVRANDAGEFAKQLADALAAPGPALIEALL